MPVIYVLPDVGVTPLAGLMADAAAWQADLADSEIHLFKAGVINPTENTTLAALDAVECDFDGYAVGAVAAMNDPYADPDGGVVVLSPLVQINYVDGVGHVGNEVGGFYVVDTDGGLRGAVKFEESVTVGSNADGVPVVFGRRFNNPV